MGLKGNWSLCGSNGKESACNAKDLGSIPGSGISPGEGNSNLLQYSCLENSMDRGALAGSMGFSRQEYRSGLPFPSPGDIPDPGIEPRSPTLQADSLPFEPRGKPSNYIEFPSVTTNTMITWPLSPIM